MCADADRVEIAGIVERRFGGIADTISERASSDIEGGTPPDLMDDIRRIETPFQQFANQE